MKGSLLAHLKKIGTRSNLEIAIKKPLARSILVLGYYVSVSIVIAAGAVNSPVTDQKNVKEVAT